MKISPARKAAFEILNRIEKEKAYSSVLLPLFQERLSQKDSSLCHELTLGVLRKKLYLDEAVNQLVHKKPRRFDVEVLNSLRLGLYQLFFLDRIPNYSAINESVNLVKVSGKRSASGLVNAVLRRASKGKPELSFESDIEELSVMTSHPKWMTEKWVNDFGYSTAKLIAEENNRPPHVSFRFTVKARLAGTEKQQSVIDRISQETDIVVSQKVRGCYTAGRITAEMRNFADAGLIYFQDPGSQLVARAVRLSPGTRFLDACAAPGGKSTLVLANNTGQKIETTRQTHIVAGDLHQHRAGNMKRNCERQGATAIDVIVYNAEREFPFADQAFQTVLVDAPCSGTGTIRHNPEIRYTVELADLKELARKQLAILINASKVVEDDGSIIYSTCSLEREENEGVIDSFLTSRTDFRRTSVDIGDVDLSETGDVRTFPYRDNMDGFFVSVLSRKA